MRWPQPPAPIQTDNITAEGVVNNKIVTKKIEIYGPDTALVTLSGSTKKFQLYWDKGPNNWGDYHTKQHPPVYHEAKPPLFAG